MNSINKRSGKLEFHICDVFFWLYILYNLSHIYIQTSLAALGTYIPMLLILVFSLCRVILLKDKNIYIKSFLAFILLLFLYCLIFMLLGGKDGTSSDRFKTANMLYSYLYSLGPVALIYLETKKGNISEKKIRMWFIVLLILFVVTYFNYFLTKEIEFDETIAQRTNNTSYLFVSLLPLVFLFYKNKITQYIFLLVLLYFIMSAMKRGAILTSAVFLCVFIINYIFEKHKNNNPWKKLFSILLLLAFVVILYRAAQSIWFNNEYFYQRLQDTEAGDANGRDWIYKTLWSHFVYETDLIQFIFGLGVQGTVTVAHIHAHNDWLELLTNCGIIGFFSYLVYYITMFREGVKNLSVKPESVVFLSCAIILLARSFFSMSFMDMGLGFALALGYSLAMCEIKRQIR